MDDKEEEKEPGRQNIEHGDSSGLSLRMHAVLSVARHHQHCDVVVAVVTKCHP